MLFSSFPFLFVFLPLTLAGFHWLSSRHVCIGQAFLLAASLVFYGYWNWRYLGLLIPLTGWNFVAGGILCRRHHRGLLALAIAINLAVLGIFKYADFFIGNMNGAFALHWPLWHLALPLALSVFTFQKIAYLVDCYRGQVTDRDPLRFALFVAFFPQLIAGPIVHYRQVIPQLQQAQPLISAEMVARGVFLFAVGLFKKVVIADDLVHIVTPIFANAHAMGFWEAWTGALAYAFELYFDFSGYCDMAIGLALLFGIRLPANFDKPYLATSIGDFWRRWHITLGAFLREYVYIPLGGNRHGHARMLAALWLTLFLLAWCQLDLRAVGRLPRRSAGAGALLAAAAAPLAARPCPAAHLSVCRARLGDVPCRQRS